MLVHLVVELLVSRSMSRRNMRLTSAGGHVWARFKNWERQTEH